MYDKQLTKGTLQPIILKMISERPKMYGYEITQEVRKITSGKIDISEGALYPILHKLENQGILETEKMYIGKRIRKYYTVTKKGHGKVSEVTNEMSDFIDTLSLIFSAPKLVE